MKNIIFFATIIAIFSIVSCFPTSRNAGPGIEKTSVFSTKVTVPVVDTDTKYSCYTGNPSGEKVVGRRDSTFIVAITDTCGFSHEELRAIGYEYTGKAVVTKPIPENQATVVRNDSNWWDSFWNSPFMDFMRWLFMVLLAILLLMLLWGIGRRIYEWMMAPVIADPINQHHMTTSHDDGNGGGDNPPALVAGMVIIPADGTYLPPKTPGEKRTLSEEPGEQNPLNDTLIERLSQNGGSVKTGSWTVTFKSPTK